jgi:hypothetical protein
VLRLAVSLALSYNTLPREAPYAHLDVAPPVSQKWAMSRPAHLFDIESPDQLFKLLKLVARRFTTAPAKCPEDMLLLVFGLTHLREWIAPDYSPREKPVPVTRSEKFYQAIFNLEEFKVLQGLCNRSKHMCATDSAMGTLHGGPIDDWPDVDSVSVFAHGPPRGYFVDGQDMDDIVQTVIKFYEDHWFHTVK